MKKVFSIVGIAVGIIHVALGIYIGVGFDKSYKGSNTKSYEFGADYYTYQYEATEHVSDNILELGNYIDDMAYYSFRVFGYAIALFGGVIICYFGCKLADAFSIPNKDVATVVNQESLVDIAEELPEI